jgi:hypothetical protein
VRQGLLLSREGGVGGVAWRITVRKLFKFIGATIVSGIGWWLGAMVGIMTAVILSAIGTGFGIYWGGKVADHYEV